MIALNILHRLIIITFFFRWLSLADSTQALSGCIPSILGMRLLQRGQLKGELCSQSCYRYGYIQIYSPDTLPLRCSRTSGNPQQIHAGRESDISSHQEASGIMYHCSSHLEIYERTTPAEAVRLP